MVNKIKIKKILYYVVDYINKNPWFKITISCPLIFNHIKQEYTIPLKYVLFPGKKYTDIYNSLHPINNSKSITDEYTVEDFILIQLLLDGKLFINQLKGSISIQLFLLCNDLFMWGCSDAEEIKYDELGIIYKMHMEDRVWGTDKYVCIKRNLKPQKPVIKNMKKDGSWDNIMESLSDNNN